MPYSVVVGEEQVGTLGVSKSSVAQKAGNQVRHVKLLGKRAGGLLRRAVVKHRPNALASALLGRIHVFQNKILSLKAHPGWDAPPLPYEGATYARDTRSPTAELTYK